MIELVPNSVDAAFEMHVPNYEVIYNRIIVTVNHVMEENHFIEWIAMLANNKIIKKFLCNIHETETQHMSSYFVR